MRRSASTPLLAALLALAVLAPLRAQVPVTVALSDFTVNSENPAFKHIGKGFAEIIAFEVKKAPQIRLVDREQRNKILEEMEFSLSGLTDPSAQLEIGKLLSVQFLVSGSITDMGGPLLVSLSMVDVQTGAVVWNDQLAESSGKYAYIGAYFGKSLLKHFNATVSKETEKTLTAAKEGDSASVVALSMGIEALDAGKKDEAKRQLSAAKKIDPGNAVAQAFLDKLAAGSAKFKVVPERYVSYYNPAYLGGIIADRLNFNLTQTWITGGYDYQGEHTLALNDAGDVGVWEAQVISSAGYAYPLGERFGVSVDISMTDKKDYVDIYEVPDFRSLGAQHYEYYGGFIGLGFALSNYSSIGAALGATYISRKFFNDDGSTDNGDEYDPYDHMDAWGIGGLVAAMVRNSTGTIGWDAVAGYGTQPSYVFNVDPAVEDFIKKADPLYVEQTLALALNKKTTIVGIKQVNDIYLDRDFYYGRLMPCVEQWFFNRFSVRAGIEGTLIVRDSGKKLGWGGTAGVSIRIWRFDLDINYTYRERPAFSIEEIIVPESVFFVTLTANGLLKK